MSDGEWISDMGKSDNLNRLFSAARSIAELPLVHDLSPSRQGAESAFEEYLAQDVLTRLADRPVHKLLSCWNAISSRRAERRRRENARYISIAITAQID